MTALGSDATQALAPDWTAALIFGVCLVIAPLAVVSLSRMRDRRRAARAKAEAPDYGSLTPREHFQWRRVSAAYNLPAVVFDEGRRPVWRDEVPVWRRALAGLLGADDLPVRPGQQDDGPDEEFLP